MSDTPRTDSFIELEMVEHARQKLDDFEHYMKMSGALADYARQLERELTTEYQRGLNDGLEQAAMICDVGMKVPIPDTTPLENEFVKMGNEVASLMAEAIRAQIKK